MMFWACTAELWRRLLGWYFLPFGLYFASLVYPAFNPLSHLTLRGQHASQVGLVVMIYAFLLSALLVYPNYFLFCAHKWVRAGFIGYITWYVFLDYACAGERDSIFTVDAKAAVLEQTRGLLPGAPAQIVRPGPTR